MADSPSFKAYRNDPPVLYLVRHGETGLNKEKCFRGWSDAPLNDKGLEAAQEVSDYLTYRPLGGITCSDLPRAVQTAAAIDMAFDRNPNLRPVDVGWFTGKSKEAFGPIFQYYLDNPDLKIPNGESLTNFRTRWESTLLDYLAIAQNAGTQVLVTHTSNITDAERILIPELPSGIPEDFERVGPGGIIAVYYNSDGTCYFEPVLGEVKHDTEPRVS